MVGEDNKGGEVVVFATEGVGDPGASGREAGEVEAGGLEESALGMDSGFADEIVDESEVVDDLAKRGDNGAKHFARLAVGGEFPGVGHGVPGGGLEEFDFFTWVPWLTVFFCEEGFVIEGVDVACSTGHEELDDAFGARWVVEVLVWGGAVILGTLEEVGEGDAAEAGKDVSAVHGRWRVSRDRGVG